MPLRPSARVILGVGSVRGIAALALVAGGQAGCGDDEGQSAHDVGVRQGSGAGAGAGASAAMDGGLPPALVDLCAPLCEARTSAPQEPDADAGALGEDAGRALEPLPEPVPAAGQACPAAEALGAARAAAAAAWGGATLARNVIVLMGDGVGPVHWDAARALVKGPLAVDDLLGPVRYRTQSLDGVTDSAASATAMATGRCTTNGATGVDSRGVPLPSVVEIAAAAGKAVGLVTNTVVPDASPMAFSTHARNRYCEDEISGQLFGITRPDVVLGGYMPDSATREGDGLDERARAAGYRIVTDRSSLLAVTDPGVRVAGFFGEGPSHEAWPDWEWGLTPEALRSADSDEPTLAQMARFALSQLSRRDAGFFLFVEDEHPDTVGHDAAARPELAAELMPYLVRELDDAVGQVIAWVEAESSFDDTLIVVCADHETGGYAIDPTQPQIGSFPQAPSHTDIPVLLFARGPGSEHLEDVAHTSDIFGLLTGQPDLIEGTGECPD